MADKTKTKNESFFSRLIHSQMIIPIVALILLVIFNLIADPSFFKITVATSNGGYPVLSGYLISILNNGSELAILAIGMTLVTAASGGQDISVGATIAIAGSVILRLVCGSDASASSMEMNLLLAFLIAVLVSMAFGAFNGALVAFFNIPPMVATLILYTAGRSIAAWINNNQLPICSDPTYAIFGNYIPGCPIPTPIFIAVICFIIMGLILKFTNLGLYVQSVGINPEASKLNGLNPKLIQMASFVILGVCVAVAALIKTSRISTINYSVIAKDIEMDAILAVALGGNSLAGGKFNLPAAILGAYIIQLLTTTLFKFNVSSAAIPAYKAVVVIILVVISSPAVQEKITELKNSKKAKEAA